MKVLIVEDDIDLNSTIKKFLSIKGVECFSVFDGDEAINLAYEKQFDLIVLDVKLPKTNGFEVAKAIRKFSDIPIIFLTSLDSEIDIEKGFLSGGDDYIIKPFSLNELFLRIKAILKRVYKDEIVKINDEIYFDTIKSALIVNNQEINLSQKELKLLELFLKNQDKILSKEEIFNTIYDFDEEPNDASLRVWINKFRKLFGKNKIQTIKNIGYKFVGI